MCVYTADRMKYAKSWAKLKAEKYKKKEEETNAPPGGLSRGKLEREIPGEPRLVNSGVISISVFRAREERKEGRDRRRYRCCFDIALQLSFSLVLKTLPSFLSLSVCYYTAVLAWCISRTEYDV